MNTKNDVEVVINGKQYTLCGYESSDYLQHIATHINEKYAEFKKQEGYNRLDVDMRNILLAINLSDDYFKAQKLAEELRIQKEELEKDFFDTKHELLSREEQVKTIQEELQKIKDACEAAERKIIRLETELEQSNKQIEKSSVQPEQDSKQPEKTEEQPESGQNNKHKSGNKRTQNRRN